MGENTTVIVANVPIVFRLFSGNFPDCIFMRFANGAIRM